VNKKRGRTPFLFLYRSVNYFASAFPDASVALSEEATSPPMFSVPAATSVVLAEAALSDALEDALEDSSELQDVIATAAATNAIKNTFFIVKILKLNLHKDIYYLLKKPKILKKS